MTMPVLKLNDRNLSVAVFENQREDGTKNYSVNISRSYKRKDATEWTTEKISCYEEDLLKMAEICRETYQKMKDLRTKKAPVEEKTEPVETDEVPF